ncbi:MAG: DNA-binding response regulator [Aquaticitalea sp.]
MFKKVLLSDDLGSITQGVFATVQRLGINDIHQVQYCDDAYIRIKKASLDNEPFDLLITDLSFQKDYREQSFQSGVELIKVIKEEFPELKVIAFSVEDRLQKVRTVMITYHADAYVVKGRKGLQELEMAIQTVHKDDTYLSTQLQNSLTSKSNNELDDYEIELLNLLSKGMSQEEICHHLKANSISPNSISTIEKKINKLRIQFKAKNAIQLVATAKDLGVI